MDVKEEARFFVATTFVRHVLLWPFLALPILLLVHFGADLFVSIFMKKFYEKNVFFAFFLF